MKMTPRTSDFAILNRFNFANQPVGVKFLFDKPEGFDRLDGKMAFCQMLRRAQQDDTAFYADLENHECVAATHLFGHDIPVQFEAGLFGAELGVFEEPRANQKVYRHVPRLEKGIVNYVAFASTNNLPFDPDVLMILTDDVDQTEIILRAMTYSTGIPFTSKMTNVLGCGHLFLYSYLSGEVNYITTGLGFGMKARKVFPAGRQIITIPHNWIPTILRNLERMTWVLPAYTDEGDEAIMEASVKLGLPLDQAG
jgi:uncharacterized protein (DUF169 family)